MVHALRLVALAAITLFGASWAEPAVVSNGKSFQRVQMKIPGLFQLQSSGVVQQPCSLGANIDKCYEFSLGSNPYQQLDTHATRTRRQRIEFRSDSCKSGSTYKFSWKHYLPKGTGTGSGSQFFHLFQVFDESANYPSVTLSANAGKLHIKDLKRTNCGKGNKGSCPSIPFSRYLGRTTLHTVTITFGGKGKMTYKVVDAKTKETIISYSCSGKMTGGLGYIKFGTYRQTFPGMKSLKANVGDYTFSKA